MIHKYKLNGYNIVLDVNSGAVHILDDVAFDILEYFEKFPKNHVINSLIDKYEKKDIEESYDELLQLKDNDILFSEDIYKDIDVNNRQAVIKAVCLHVTHDCNLKCKYCFAEEGEYKGERSLMSFETGKQALDFLIKNSGNRTNLEVDFFGGEPLMNFEVVKKLVEYGRNEEKKYNKNFRFTITTNGVLLNDEIQNYINENMQNVVISLDGRKEVNDFMRIKKGGTGSYDTVMPKFKKLADSRNQNNYYIRGTFTRNNLDFSKDVLHFADEGFKQISVEPVVADESENYSIRKEDLEVIFNEYENLALQILERKKQGQDFNFFHYMIDLQGGPCAAKRLIGCGAGTEYIAVTPTGEIYPCHQFVGNEKFKLGDIYNGIEKTKLVKEFEKCNVYAKEECKNCFAKFYCSGGCASNAYNFSGDILKPYEIGCEMQRKRIECAIMIKAAEQLENI